MLVMNELTGIPVDKINAARERPDPHIFFRVPVDLVWRISGSTGRIYIVMTIGLKFTGDGIQNAEPFIFRANPSITFPVFPQVTDRIAVNTILNAIISLIMHISPA